MKTVLLLLIVSFGVCAVADAGIFKPGNRFIFGWRRPDASVDEPPPDNPAPFVDSTLVGPSPQDDKIDAVLDAIMAATMPQPTPEPTRAELIEEILADGWVPKEWAEESQSELPGGFPPWSIPIAASGITVLGMGSRRVGAFIRDLKT